MTSLLPGVVDVWLSSPTADGRRAEYERLLSVEERARHDRFVRECDREMFLTAHARLRLILSQYAPIGPAEWQFRIGEHGRPSIANADAGAALHFSLSHTDGLIAIAVHADEHIGVDVERVTRRVDREAVAPRVFTAPEIAWTDRDRDGRRFFDLWTLKEAYAKARGRGFGIDFRRVAFDVTSTRIAARFDPSLEDDESAWQFELWQPTAEHVCAIAVRRPPGSRATIVTRDLALPR